MHIKFRVTFEDGTTMDSHDEMWNEVRTHAHALPPNNDKRWIRYELLSDEGHQIGVDFRNGEFCLNGTILSPPWNGISGDKHEKSEDFVATEQWRFMKDLPYFPIIGRRVYELEGSEVRIPFCGWKAKIGGQKVDIRIGMMPDGSARLVE